MEFVLEYASPPVPRKPNFWLGAAVATGAVISSAGIIVFAHINRMGMETARGASCGLTRTHCEQNLMMIGFVLVVPGVLCWLARYAKVGVPVARTSLVCAIAGWLIYYLSIGIDVQ